MNILVIWPPHVPAYFNAGHHLPLFVVGEYLRQLFKDSKVTCLDAGALTMTWKTICKSLVEGKFDVAVVMNEFGNARGVCDFARYCRQMSPGTKIITFGRLSSQVPGFFRRFAIDAVVSAGDYEAGVAAYLDSLSGRPERLAGVAVREHDSWHEPLPGVFLNATEWAFPNIEEIPFSAYERLYVDDTDKFCGIPGRRELVVPVARGCPVACEFCEVPRQQGLRERRRPVEAVVRFMRESFSRIPFEYASMYAPTFTLDRAWVHRFCDTLVSENNRVSWKCVTTLHHLDRPLVLSMGNSGCVRISIGLETLPGLGAASLPAIKQVRTEQFDRLVKWCSSAGIELNCFVIVGLPGQSIQEAKNTMSYVRQAGARVRATVYTPYHALSAEMDDTMIDSFDRQFVMGGEKSLEDLEAIYQLVHGHEPSPTQVMARIPIRTSKEYGSFT